MFPISIVAQDSGREGKDPKQISRGSKTGSPPPTTYCASNRKSLNWKAGHGFTLRRTKPRQRPLKCRTEQVILFRALYRCRKKTAHLSLSQYLIFLFFANSLGPFCKYSCTICRETLRPLSLLACKDCFAIKQPFCYSHNYAMACSPLLLFCNNWYRFTSVLN